MLTLPFWIPRFLLVTFLDPSKKLPPARGVAITFDGSGASIKPEKKRVRKRVVWRWKPFFQEKDPIIHHDVFLLAEF